MKGTTFFVVVALIGTGWAFIKPYLNERDRQILLLVVPLQIISNIALAVVEETAPGSRAWFAWYDLLRVVDILCCVAILVPTVGSIQHLQALETSDSSGKAAQSVEKLKLFREFYLSAICYFYFTRIIVFLLDSSLFCRWTWISAFVSETCTFGFFVLTG